MTGFGIGFLALGMLMLIGCWAVRHSYVGPIILGLCALYCFLQAIVIL